MQKASLLSLRYNQHMTQQADWPIKIIRSSRRKKSVSGKLKEGTLIIRAPKNMSDAELTPIISNLKKRLQKKLTPIAKTDEEAEAIAQQLNQQYFAGKLHWQSIRFVTNQNTLYGSCTPANGTIRLNHRLANMPDWVLTYVIMHELAHLREANHGPNFWVLVNRYPLTERARGYLMAVSLENLTDSF